ncbi:ester cyclase [Frigidibacter sp. MR17.14]|uniref:ester cyclase n=1 Tax=Frigidibacter sp. MR17.14 TaxID=3126509 RepID=UPI0030130597
MRKLLGHRPRSALERDVAAIPEPRCTVALLWSEPLDVTCRLNLAYELVGTLFGLCVNGQRVRFDETTFYRLAPEKLVELRSVIDKAAIAGQLA